MKRREAWAIVAVAASAVLVSEGRADLLGVQPGFPQLFFDNQGMATYDATTDLFHVSATPTAIRFAAGAPPRFVTPTGDPPVEFVELAIEVDQDGMLAGGVPGNDFIVIGEVDEDGDDVPDYAGILLTGEVVAFGFLNIGGNAQNSLGKTGTDLYDFRFVVTGGSLAPLFAGQDLGVVLTSEMSTFMGDFGEDFEGEAKGVGGPIDQPGEGACCFPNGFCMELPQDECEANGGLFQGDGTMCGQVICMPPKGACCFDDGSCGVLTQDDCNDQGGDYQGDDTLCQDVDCPTPEQACCFPDGNCALLMQDECLDQGGLPQGDGTDCMPNDCPQVPGACCFPDGSCGVLMPPVCLDQGGLPQGPGTDCSPNDCPQPPEACCFADGSCAVLMRDDCLDQGGLPQGNGTNCAPNLCPPPKGACCFDDGSCAVIMQDECNAQGGAYQGDDTLCQDVDCPGPAGACCLPGGGCLELEQDDCAAQGGLYQGDGTQCGPATCPVDGACCLEGECFQATQKDCNAQGGDYQGDGTECGPGLCPPVKGACCFDDGQCAFVEDDECAAGGGDYQGDNVLCGPGVCPQPFGACCFPTMECEELMQDDCNAQGGAYQGDGTTCTPGLCPPPLGACCFDDGSCAQLSQDDCAATGGLYQGDFTMCEPELCPPVKGACCFADGSCQVVPPAECNPAGGLYQGDGTICAPGQCSPPSGACCFDDGTCIVTDQMSCADAGGGFQGTGTVCEPGLCEVPGACCFCEAPCEDGVFEAACEAAGGVFLGQGSTCGPIGPITLSFTTEDDFVTPLVNGQHVTTPPEFGTLVAISGSGDNEGPAIFDSTDGGPNDGGPDPDLLVDLGNILILQSSDDPDQSSPDVFDVPNDSANGGTLTFDFLFTVEALSIDLVDLCPLPGQDAIVTLTDTGGRARVFDVPEGWTSDVNVEGGAGFGTLDLTSLAPQPGFQSVATASEDAGFEPLAVVSMDIEFGKSAATDNLVFLITSCPPDICPPPVGACCLPDGSCAEINEAACDGQGGIYQGNLTTCGQINCLEGACCLDGDCVVTTEADCLEEGGEFQGNGTECSPSALGQPGTYRLGNHPDGGSSPPPYGMKLSDLFDLGGSWTFDFEAPGTAMFLDYDGSTIRIHGIAFGGKDDGDDYEPGLTSFVEIDFTYHDVSTAPGDDDLVSDESNPPDSGTLVWLQNGAVVQLVEKDGENPFAFRFGDENDDDGHRGFPGLSGWGWFEGEGTNDWLFTAHDLCEPQTLSVIERQIASDDDDAEERSDDGWMYLDSSDLELVDDDDYGETDMVGLRFTNLGIPQGATIASAWIQFQVDEESGGSASLVIRGQDANHASQFEDDDHDISDRALTSASVGWSPPEWDDAGDAGPDQRTPDIASVIQEIVSRSGWSSGNALAIVITGNGTRTAEAHDGDDDGAAVLHVEWY